MYKQKLDHIKEQARSAAALLGWRLQHVKSDEFGVPYYRIINETGEAELPCEPLGDVLDYCRGVWERENMQKTLHHFQQV